MPNHISFNCGGGTYHNFTGSIIGDFNVGGGNSHQVKVEVEGEVSVDNEPCEDGTITIEVRESFVYVNGVRTASNNVDIKIKGSVNSVHSEYGSLSVTGDVKGDLKSTQGSVRVGGDVCRNVRCDQGSVRVAGNVDGDVKVGQGTIQMNRN